MLYGAIAVVNAESWRLTRFTEVAGILGHVDIFSVQPVEGVELCRLETPSRGCSVSDDEGRFSLEMPADGEHWFTVTHPDYYAFLLAMKTLMPLFRQA